MSEELSMKDLQMKGLTEKIDMLLKGLDKSKRPELDLAEIGNRLRDFQTSLDGAQLELKHQLGAHVQKSDFTKLLRDHKYTLKELNDEFAWRKAASDKNSLMKGAKPAASSSSAGNMSTVSGMMSHGIAVQQAGTASLLTSIARIEEAKVIGAGTVVKLDANSHQLASVYDEIERIDTTLERTTKVIKRIARRMVTDKILWVLTFLLVAAIVVIIVWQRIK